MKKYAVVIIMGGLVMLITGCALPVGDDYQSLISRSPEESTIIADYNLRSYVPIPVAGETPVKAVNTRADMDISVVWKDGQGVDISGTLSSFAQNTVYQADISLSVKPGSVFDSAMNFKYLPGDLVTVQPGDDAGVALRNLSTVMYKPAQPPIPITDDLDLAPYIPMPVTGETPVLSFAALKYAGTVAWETTTGIPLIGSFVPGTTYKAVIMAYAASGYIFTGLPSTGGFVHTGAADDPLFEINTARPAQGTITVVFKPTGLISINDYNLQNYIPIPVEGQRPVKEINRPELRGEVNWFDALGSPIPNPETYAFILDKIYLADITLTAKADYTFMAGANFKYIPDSMVSIQPDDEEDLRERALTRVTYKATKAPQPVTLWDLTPYLPQPVSGGTPAATIATAQYTGTIKWSPGEADGIFLPRKTYGAELSLTAVSGYTFAGIGSGPGSFTHYHAQVNPNPPIFTPGGDPFTGKVVINFPETGALSISDYNALSYVPLPVAGQKPIRSASFPGLTMSVAWTWQKKGTSGYVSIPNDVVFQGDDQYEAVITLTAGIGYAFDTHFAYSSPVISQSNSSDLEGQGKYSQTLTVTYKPVERNILSFGPDNGTLNSALKLLYDERNNSSFDSAHPLEVELPAGWETVSTGVTLTKTNNSPAGVIIDGHSRTLQLTGKGSIITVGNGVTLTLRNIILEGRSENTTALIQVKSGGSLILQSGALVRGNHNVTSTANNNYGGGVSVSSGGTFTMEGGSISGNSAYMCGGGVHVDSGVFIMKGGTITGNRTRAGGGVSVTSRSSNDRGKFTMEGGTISDNMVAVTGAPIIFGGGGGVYIGANSEFLMKDGGTISDNRAISTGFGGGGVCAYTAKEFIMDGGTISGNISNEAGGGIYSTSSSFVMSGGTVSGNSVITPLSQYSRGGGGLFVSYFTMEGGTISYNTSTVGGGGVFCEETFTMKGGTIRDNTTMAEGGGVRILALDAEFIMEKGTIWNNTADSGGGVFVSNYTTFTMEDGTIQNNQAVNGGGAYVEGNGTFTQTGGIITGNTADIGGGIVVGYESGGNNKFTMGDNAWVDKNNPVYLNTTYTRIHIIGTLSSPGPVANIIISVPPVTGKPVLSGDYNVANNYQKFLFYDEPGKIDSDGKSL